MILPKTKQRMKKRESDSFVHGPSNKDLKGKRERVVRAEEVQRPWGRSVPGGFEGQHRSPAWLEQSRKVERMSPLEDLGPTKKSS